MDEEIFTDEEMSDALAKVKADWKEEIAALDREISNLSAELEDF